VGEDRTAFLGACHVIQICKLHATIKCAVPRKLVDHHAQTCREPLDQPHALKASVGVAVQPALIMAFVVFHQRAAKYLDVRHRRIQTLSACGWNDVGGIASKEHAAKAHGFTDETAHGGDGFLRDATFMDGGLPIDIQSVVQCRPDAIV